MTASRRKRLEQLEQARAERNAAQLEALTSRALEFMTSAEREGLSVYLDRVETPEGAAALERLWIWGGGVPEVRDAPELTGAGLAWWKHMAEGDPLADIPPITPEALADVEQYAGQWREVAARTDCPEQVMAAELAALWAWWAALARAARGERRTAPPEGPAPGRSENFRDA